MIAEATDAFEVLSGAQPDLAARLVGRVRRGAELLDLVDADWHSRVAGYELSMESCGRCVLGQIFGDYYLGLSRVMGKAPEGPYTASSRYGFSLSVFDMRCSEAADLWAALAELWRREIRARLDRRVNIPST